MSDLINRQEAIDALEWKWAGKAALDAIKALPSAERKGKWINKPNVYGVAYCSECDFELHINDTNFCPNCGADMRGEEDEID